MIESPAFEPFKTLLLEMAGQRSLDALLQLIVRRLADRPHSALARIWLIGPGDICAKCHLRPECPDQTSCLHLVASAGSSREDPDADWARIDGNFRRMPMGVRKVGKIGATGEALIVEDIEKDPTWIAHPEWALREGIRGFCGQPLIHRGEVLGVLALFVRRPGVSEGHELLRLVADHAASAIANARAFEEIERLQRQFALENEYLREEVSEAREFGDIVGESSAIRNVMHQIELVAPTEANVLILGESGTGKELVAHAIHRRSHRSGGAMVRVNCASVPRELYESEFFGHARGAFTGAVRDRAGRFDLANRGTLFLDEVGEIPVDLQPKLLRVLQEGCYERVGEERTRKTDVRIVAATNRDLKKEAAEGRFRQDLYYRLNVFPLEVAPLRERKEDIPLLATHFLESASRRLKVDRPRLTQANVLQLQQYDWPGNIRELQNVIERAVITAHGGRLRFDLPATIRASGPARGTPVGKSLETEVISDDEMRRLEKENLHRALEQAHWKIYGPGGAADVLGMKPTTLASRMKKLGLRKPR